MNEVHVNGVVSLWVLESAELHFLRNKAELIEF